MPILTQTVPPFPAGMNVEQAPWALDDDQCRYAQDVMFDKPNLARRRGPVKRALTVGGSNITTPATAGNYAVGLVGTRQPDSAETWRVAVLHGTASAGSPKFGVLSADYLSRADVDWYPTTGTFDPTKRYAMQASPHPLGGIIVGVSQGFGPEATNQALGHWAGASKADNTAGTITVAQDGLTVTGSGTSFSGNVEPGMFLYSRADVDPSSSGDRTYIGTVRSVESNTSLTLVEGALLAVTARSFRIRTIRPLSRKVAKGLITCNKDSRVVQGHGTKFIRQGLRSPTGTGHWAIFRADDMKYIGIVDLTVDANPYENGVASDTELKLTANATVNCNKDKFVAIDLYDNFDIPTASTAQTGFLTARWANRQWYANRKLSTRNNPLSPSRVFFSDVFDAEALDMTADGDHLFIPSSQSPVKPITAIAPTPSALACFKPDEMYAVLGTDETNFSVRKILDDGCLFPQTIVQWRGGIVWAGKRGIWYWDGAEEPFNLLEDRMGQFYEKALSTHPIETAGAWGMLHKDHYIVFIDRATPTQGPVKSAGAADTTGVPTKYLAVCINLTTRALSLLTNFSFQGAIDPPYENAQGTLYLVNDLNLTNPWAINQAYIAQADDLFTATGVDEIFTKVVTPADNAKGPDFYVETRRYDLGDPQMKKRFKQLQMIYKLQSTQAAGGSSYITTGDTNLADYTNNNLVFALMEDLNEDSKILSATWPLTRIIVAGSGAAGFRNDRKKTRAKGSHIAFKFWQSNLTTVKDVRLGPLAIGFKWMRPGKT